MIPALGREKFKKIIQTDHPLPRLTYCFKRAQVFPVTLIDFLVDTIAPIERCILITRI